MELFKLFGTIAIQNADANDAIDDTTDKAEQSESKISGAFKKIGKVVAGAMITDKIKDFGLNCINAAADANAASSQFSQVFGDMESQAKKSLTGIADNTGIQVNRMKGSYTQIAAFAKTTGMDTSNALGLADRAMVAVADSAAFYDRTLEETTESLQSFLKGNYENDSALGLSCTEVTRNEAANRLYGKSFKDLSEAQKQLTLLQMVEDANKASGALGQAARESDTWTNQTGNLKQAWTDFQSVLGQKVLPLAVEAVKKASEAVQGLSEKVENASTYFEAFKQKIVDVQNWCVQHQAGLAMVGLALGTITTAILAYNAAAIAKKVLDVAETAQIYLLIAAEYAHSIASGVATAATTAFGAAVAFLTSPISLVILAIGALVAAAVLLYQNWDTVKAKCIEVWDTIKEFISNVTNAIQAIITKVWSTIKSFISSILDNIKSTVTTVWNAISSTVSSVMNTIKTTISNIWNSIKSTVSSVINEIKSIISSVFNAIKSTISGILNSIKSTFSSIWNSIKSTVSNAINGVKSTISSGLNAAKSVVSGVLEAIKSKFSSIFEDAKNIVRNAINTIKGFFNFSWSLPKIKLPHFSISGKFSLNPPQIPHFSVSWYKKAMDNPVMFTKPTIFSMNPATGQAKGAGEAGDELMIGKETMLNMIAQAVGERNRELIETLEFWFGAIIDAFGEFFPQFANQQIVLDSGELVGATADKMDAALGKILRDIERGVK